MAWGGGRFFGGEGGALIGAWVLLGGNVVCRNVSIIAGQFFYNIYIPFLSHSSLFHPLLCLLPCNQIVKKTISPSSPSILCFVYASNKSFTQCLLEAFVDLLVFYHRLSPKSRSMFGTTCSQSILPVIHQSVEASIYSFRFSLFMQKDLCVIFMYCSL